MSSPPVCFHHIYDLAESTTTLEQRCKGFLLLMCYLSSSISLSQNSTKYHSLCKSPHCIRYSSASVLQYDNATENQMDYPEIAYDGTTRYSAYQPLKVYSVMDRRQEDIVHHLFTALCRTILAQSKQGAQPISNQ